MSRWHFELVEGASVIIVRTQPNGKLQFSMPLWLYQELKLTLRKRGTV